MNPKHPAEDKQIRTSSGNPNSTTVQPKVSLKHIKRTPQGGPRSAGFSKNATLTEWLEFSNERNFRALYEALRGDPPAPNEYYTKPLYEVLGHYSIDPVEEDVKSEGRKHFLDALFRARFKHKSATPTVSKKMLQLNDEAGLALQRTSNGHTYGQIFPTKVYGGASNASTYRINARKQSRESLAQEVDEMPTVPAKDLKNGVANNGRAIHKADRRVETDDGPPSQLVNKHTRPLHNSPPHRSPDIHGSTTVSLGKRFGVHRSRKGKINPTQHLNELPKPMIEAPPAIPSPLHRTNGSIFGLSQEFTHILSRPDSPKKALSNDQHPLGNAQSQPTIRDFATHGSSFVKAARALRVRSRSPMKRASKQQQQQQQQQSPQKVRDFRNVPTFKPPIRNTEASFPQRAGPALFPEETMILSNSSSAPSPMTPESVIRKPVHDLRPSPIADTFSKSSSVMSTETTAEDTLSDASSAVVSRAQSAVVLHPPMPGPAPTMPLPLLPEGHDAPIPVTPRLSRNMASPECSPTQTSPSSPARVPPKSPARYRFTPNAGSPPKPKRPASPTRRNAATENENIHTPTSSPKRQTFPYTTPHQDLLPKSFTARSTSAGDIENVQQKRVENAQLRKAKDLQLARMKSQKADIDDVTPGASVTLNEGELHQGIVELPSVRGSYNGSIKTAKHNAQQPSQINDLSLSIAAHRQRESVILSHRLSPIIVVAEQAPTPPTQRAPSQTSSHNRDSVDEYLQSHYPESHTSRTSIDDRPQRPTTNGFFPKPPKPASPSLHLPEEENSRLRPSSVHSMPISRPVSLSAQSVRSSRPIAARVPTPFADPLLRAEGQRSSRHSSIHTADDLEARLAVIEKKNVMLESALMAVINCSSRYDTSARSSGTSINGGEGSSVASGIARLRAGLDIMPFWQASTSVARFSSASGP